MLDWELIAYGLVALLVLGRLYSIFGRKTGAEPPPGVVRENALRHNRQDDRTEEGPTPVWGGDPDSPAANGLRDIARCSPEFSPQTFLDGSRKAYALIVNAFANGDLDSLRKLLTGEVFSNYRDAINRRKKAGTAPFSLARLKSAEITGAGLAENGLASISTRFEAELSDGERSKMVREIWTFQRYVASRNPNWLLAGVEIGT